MNVGCAGRGYTNSVFSEGEAMRIALLAPDSKIPNLALMKLSAWHKSQGDSVEAYLPIFQEAYDRLYISKVFDFSPEPEYLPSCEIVRGGTAYDLKTDLPPEVETMFPDYEIFKCNYAMGFTSRGCIRKCPFCVVPEKEGKARATLERSKGVNAPGQQPDRTSCTL